jgi:uncharacterized membrane protein (UPF0136 family)
MNLTIIILLAAYATLLEIGGIIGYQKAGSKASLIAGVASGSIFLLLAIVIRITGNLFPAVYLALIVSLGLAAMFIKRYRATGKVMPAGMLAAVSLVVTLLLGITLLPK